jgi:hypothetical protein
MPSKVKKKTLPNFLDPEPFDFLKQSQSISSIEVHPISSIGSHLSQV